MALQTQFISTFQQGHTLSTLFYSIPHFNLSHINTKFFPQDSCFPLFSLFLQPSFIKIPSSLKNLARTWLISSTEYLLQCLLEMWTVRSFVKYSASLSNTGSMTVVLVAGGSLANITWVSTLGLNPRVSNRETGPQIGNTIGDFQDPHRFQHYNIDPRCDKLSNVFIPAVATTSLGFIHRHRAGQPPPTCQGWDTSCANQCKYLANIVSCTQMVCGRGSQGALFFKALTLLCHVSFIQVNLKLQYLSQNTYCLC